MNEDEILVDIKSKLDSRSLKDFYAHIPILQLPVESYSILGGRLRHLTLEEFEALDSDWAHENQFADTNPVFWHYDFDFAGRISNDRNEFFSEAKDKVMLIHNALILMNVTEYWPNPHFSMRYLREKNGLLERKIGLFHRTYILNRKRGTPLTNEQLEFIKNSVESWYDRRLSYQDHIFILIHAISSVTSGNLPSNSSILPLVVALEGFLIDSKVDGIAKEITRRIMLLFQKTAFKSKVDVERIVKQSYSWRSNLIHGKSPDTLRFNNPVTELLCLLGEITIAALHRVTAIGISTKELTSFQKNLYED
ncbi:hypothetical protein [Neobacillus cucumis]|uniref:hypothetical protein n=1 Tax=Neobacillus cucumis TaxID=1740721 RepID=UPI002E1A8C34|nr:HEPN domain-containing protein [Neobacillus cucumis]